MTQNIPCEVAKDLMPSYIDGLTSEVTNELLEAHVASCEDCKASLDAMREVTDLPDQPAQAETKEIDFLKKNRRRNRIILWAAVAVVCSLLLAFYVRYYVIGEVMVDAFRIHDIQVDGTHLSIKGEAKSNAYYRVKSFSEEEKDGVVTFTARGARRVFAPQKDDSLFFNAEYEYDTEITMVRMDERILWHDGARVSALASDVYETRHEHMGDMPANAKTANALDLSAHLGAYRNELLSEEAPYTWKLHLEEELQPGEVPVKEERMRSFACVMLGVIGNLDAVTFEYVCRGETHTVTVTAEEATAFFGQEIKSCMQSARLVDELLHKTGLQAYARFDSTMPGEQGKIVFQIRNDSDTPFSLIRYVLYHGQGILAVGGETKVNVIPYEKGEMYLCILDAMGEVPGECHIEFVVRLTDGTEYPVEERILLPEPAGTLQMLTLTGNPEEGFHISQ